MCHSQLKPACNQPTDQPTDHDNDIAYVCSVCSAKALRSSLNGTNSTFGDLCLRKIVCMSWFGQVGNSVLYAPSHHPKLENLGGPKCCPSTRVAQIAWQDYTKVFDELPQNRCFGPLPAFNLLPPTTKSWWGGCAISAMQSLYFVDISRNTVSCSNCYSNRVDLKPEWSTIKRHPICRLLMGQ